ncbi:MAG TPA: Mur ligase family protein, partial [Polyangiaceae bacterium]
MKSGFPSPPAWHQDLVTVGVTGTNGKTTTTTFVAAGLGTLQKPVPWITTLGSYLNDEQLKVSTGYAGFVETMRAGRDRGATHAAAEYTSEALARGFAQAWPCRIAVFTNLTRD